MKFTLHVATFEPVEVEVPDVCPDCGAAFRGEGSELVEWNYHDVGGRVDPASGDYVNGMEREGEDYFATEFRCRQCDYTITPHGSTEPAAKED